MSNGRTFLSAWKPSIFTRLANGFSMKLDNHVAAVAQYKAHEDPHDASEGVHVAFSLSILF
jgi:hypothetical protein